MSDAVIDAAQNAFAQRLRNSSDVSDNTKNAQAIAKAWRSAVYELDPDRFHIEALVAPAWRFACETPQRVPLTDWYWTREAKHAGFQARSVVGGVFVKMLADEAVWRKWAGKAGS